MSSSLRQLAIVALVIVLAGPLSAGAPPASADSAPMWESPVGLKPGSPNNTVRMTAETVDIDVIERDGAVYAQVSAVFDLTNRGADTQMRVGFPQYNYPVEVPEYPRQVSFSSEGLASFRAWSGSTQYRPRVEKVIPEGSRDTWGTEWFVWDMSFPRGSTTRLNVSYEQKLSEGSGAANVFYVLTTGALWNGSIGSASVRMNAPGGGALTAADTPGSYRFAGKIAWEMRDFEPTKDVLGIYIPASPWKALRTTEEAFVSGTATAADYATGATAVVTITEDGMRAGPERAALRDLYFPRARQWAQTAIGMDEGNAAAWEALADLDVAPAVSKHGYFCLPTMAADAYQRAIDLGSPTAAAKLAEMRDNVDWTTTVVGPLEPCS